MELILIVLCGILMGAINVGCFMLGYYFRGKNPTEEGVTVTQDNRDFITEMMEWRNYNGGK